MSSVVLNAPKIAGSDSWDVIPVPEASAPFLEPEAALASKRRVPPQGILSLGTMG